MILRTSYAKLADPSERSNLARALADALGDAGHAWLHIGTPADASSEVWDLAIVAGCPDADAVAEHHRRVVARLGDAAVVFKAWSFSAATPGS